VIHKLLRILGQHPQPEGYFLAQLNKQHNKIQCRRGGELNRKKSVAVCGEGEGGVGNEEKKIIP
jgi:hypothetical protein